MARRITVTVEAEMTDDQYSDLANTIWMLMRQTPYADFLVAPDSHTPVDVLNAAWERYGEDARWE